MTNNPKVSVVVPSLNSIKYIHECIDSILNQTLKDIEIICVDAGSTDGTLEVLREYEKNDERLKVIVSDKKSYGYQMNLGIKEAKGEYLGIVESDDYIKENMYQSLYKIAKERKIEVLRADILEFETIGSEKRIHYASFDNKPYMYGHIVNSKDDINVMLTIRNLNPPGIYLLQFIRDNNCYFNETLGASFQDTGFSFQIQALANRVFLLNEAYYFYRQDNPEASCKSRTKAFCICDEYDFIYNFVKSNEKLDGSYMYVVAYLRFCGYEWMLNKIDEKLKYDFIQRFHRDFVVAKNNNEIDWTLFSQWQKNILQQVIEKPLEFYKQKSCKPIGACEQVKKQLSYSLGAELIKSVKNPLLLLFLPYRLFFIYTKYKINKIILDVLYEKKILTKHLLLEDYADYHEAVELKEHLSYKLGESMIKSPIFFIFKIPKIYKNFKNRKGKIKTW
ncbi:glycosyltransferase family 2 protein [Campylobacter coli]|uniref:glycosyltransferase n=2 Tax=Campylobacter coli TaxID=195 RepID=UPI000257F943|nr:glycosyltransferase family 2 protein [Campylobacter coli]EAC1286489.1 glycosyltransferase [Campylobacter coli]EAH4965757.1 glycosyltransferase [Campylobacter coli]EAH5278915.1 glycosyltransferase [Campylobacter coli]EAH5753386.1 glycosyltransferase [Campylobacter coli]EAH6494940.1 glycosyltransferase [Campylobacter coli]